MVRASNMHQLLSVIALTLRGPILHPMRGNIIERALEIAPECGTVYEVRKRLAHEGYLGADAHLAGKLIRQQISDRLDPELRRLARLPPAERRLDQGR